MSIVHLPVLQPVRETRSRRKREVRARTINVKRLTKRELEFGRMLADAQLEDLDVTRPVTRGDCEADERPCPFVSCKFHLYLDVADRTGAIKLNFPDVDPEQLERLPATCMLDVAERERTLEEVGEFMNMTRERIRQIEVRALTKMKRATDRGALGDYAEELPDNGRVTDADVEQLEREQAHERTKAMPNFGYSEKVWNVLSDGRRISVAQIAKDADVSYKVARQTVANFHNAGKVRIFDGEDGGIDVELVPGAERVKKRTPKAATGQKKNDARKSIDAAAARARPRAAKAPRLVAGARRFARALHAPLLRSAGRLRDRERRGRAARRAEAGLRVKVSAGKLRLVPKPLKKARVRRPRKSVPRRGAHA